VRTTGGIRVSRSEDAPWSCQRSLSTVGSGATGATFKARYRRLVATEQRSAPLGALHIQVRCDACGATLVQRAISSAASNIPAARKIIEPGTVTDLTADSWSRLRRTSGSRSSGSAAPATEELSEPGTVIHRSEEAPWSRLRWLSTVGSGGTGAAFNVSPWRVVVTEKRRAPLRRPPYPACCDACCGIAGAADSHIEGPFRCTSHPGSGKISES
jgi:hypothetical protein